MTDEDYGLDVLEGLNITDTRELDCLVKFLQSPYVPESSGGEVLLESISNGLVCNSTWDGILCWPNTLAGTTSVLPCFDELNGIKYDTSRKLIIAGWEIPACSTCVIHQS